MSQPKFLCAALAGCAMLLACEPASLVKVDPPGTVADPATVSTASGAQQLYTLAYTQFAYSFNGGSATSGGSTVTFTTTPGSLTDELMVRPGEGEFADFRSKAVSSGLIDPLYQQMHIARTRAQQARQAIQLYGTPAMQPLAGELMAWEAFAIVWFGEAFCSGIPLSSVPLVGAPVLSPGLSTIELFERAVGLFDSAMVAGADSVSFVNLARIGKGRALLNLGKSAEAAAAVAAVPTGFTYEIRYNANLANQFAVAFPKTYTIDREGTNGLDWSADPRTAIRTATASAGMPLSAKYYVTAGVMNVNVPNPAAPIRLGDGLEARLIEAEAALEANSPTWITTVNMLRATCIGTAACAPLPGLTASSLPPLAVPASASAKLDLMMRERAMWLFLTGHRLGDLRRMVRIYKRDAMTLYPVGPYVNGPFAPAVGAHSFNGRPYGDDLVLTPPTAEQTNNPLYQGCFNTTP